MCLLTRSPARCLVQQRAPALSKLALQILQLHTLLHVLHTDESVCNVAQGIAQRLLSQEEITKTKSNFRQKAARTFVLFLRLLCY